MSRKPTPPDVSIRNWLPRREYSERHKFILVSANHWFYLGLASDIYSFHLVLGKLSITWDATEQAR